MEHYIALVTAEITKYDQCTIECNIIMQCPFQVSLGGFLGQRFSELTNRCPRVASLVLCQSYCDTAHATTSLAGGL